MSSHKFERDGEKLYLQSGNLVFPCWFSRKASESVRSSAATHVPRETRRIDCVLDSGRGKNKKKERGRNLVTIYSETISKLHPEFEASSGSGRRIIGTQNSEVRLPTTHTLKLSSIKVIITLMIAFSIHLHTLFNCSFALYQLEILFRFV